MSITRGGAWPDYSELTGGENKGILISLFNDKNLRRDGGRKWLGTSYWTLMGSSVSICTIPSIQWEISFTSLERYI